jgi:hypothetical protein
MEREGLLKELEGNLRRGLCVLGRSRKVNHWTWMWLRLRWEMMRGYGSRGMGITEIGGWLGGILACLRVGAGISGGCIMRG